MKRIKIRLSIVTILITLGIWFLYKAWIPDVVALFTGSNGTVEIQQSITVFPSQETGEGPDTDVLKNYSELHVEFSSEATLVISAHLKEENANAAVKILLDGVECPTISPERFNQSIVEDIPAHAVICTQKLDKGKHHILAYNDGFKASSENKVMLRNYILHKSDLNDSLK